MPSLLLLFYAWHATWCMYARMHGWKRRQCRLQSHCYHPHYHPTTQQHTPRPVAAALPPSDTTPTPHVAHIPYNNEDYDNDDDDDGDDDDNNIDNNNNRRAP